MKIEQEQKTTTLCKHLRRFSSGGSEQDNGQMSDMTWYCALRYPNPHPRWCCAGGRPCFIAPGEEARSA